MARLIYLVLLLPLAACGAGQAPSQASTSTTPTASVRELIDPRAGLYAGASRVGDLVWTAGHLPEGVEPSDDIALQVDQVLTNLEDTLEAAGAGLDTVVKVNVYLTNFEDWEAFNRVFSARMSEFGLPPRTTVEVSELGFGYGIEMEMVAHVRDADGR